MGVCPRGDHVRHAVGSSEKPLSCTKTSVAFTRWAFFFAAARCARPRAGWPSCPARGHGCSASANSSQSNGTSDTPDRGPSERGNTARSDWRPVVWSTPRSRSREPRPPVRAGGTTGPASVAGVSAEGPGCLRRAGPRAPARRSARHYVHTACQLTPNRRLTSTGSNTMPFPQPPSSPAARACALRESSESHPPR